MSTIETSSGGSLYRHTIAFRDPPWPAQWGPPYESFAYEVTSPKRTFIRGVDFPSDSRYYPAGWYPGSIGFSDYSEGEVIHYIEKAGSRQRNPYDDPPGIGYKAMKKQGLLVPPLPYRSHFVVTTVQTGSYYFSGHGVCYKHRLLTTSRVTNNSNIADLSALDEKARFNLYASFSRRTKWKGGVAIAELGSSLDLLGRMTITLLRCYRSIKKGDFKSAMTILGEHYGSRGRSRFQNRPKGADPDVWASQAWLELQFGIKPLMADIYNLVDYIASYTAFGSPYTSFNGYSNWQDIKTVRYVDIGSGGLIRYEFNGKGRYAYSCIGQTTDPLQAFLNSIGVSNGYSIAYEVFPFSFVLDWFMPLGSWIDSLSAEHGMDIFGVQRSSHLQGELRAIAPDRMAVCTLNNFQRVGTILPSYPVVRTSFKNILRPWTLITSAALWRSLRKMR